MTLIDLFDAFDERAVRLVSSMYDKVDIFTVECGVEQIDTTEAVCWAIIHEIEFIGEVKWKI